MNDWLAWLKAWRDLAESIGWAADGLIFAVCACIVAGLLIGTGSRRVD